MSYLLSGGGGGGMLPYMTACTPLSLICALVLSHHLLLVTAQCLRALALPHYPPLSLSHSHISSSPSLCPMCSVAHRGPRAPSFGARGALTLALVTLEVLCVYLVVRMCTLVFWAMWGEQVIWFSRRQPPAAWLRAMGITLSPASVSYIRSSTLRNIVSLCGWCSCKMWLLCGLVTFKPSIITNPQQKCPTMHSNTAQNKSGKNSLISNVPAVVWAAIQHGILTLKHALHRLLLSCSLLSLYPHFTLWCYLFTAWEIWRDGALMYVRKCAFIENGCDPDSSIT